GGGGGRGGGTPVPYTTLFRSDLGLNVLDHQLLDAEGRRCGKVDDLALEGGPGEDLELAAMLCGPGVWRGRAGLTGRIAAWLGGRSEEHTSELQSRFDLVCRLL